MNDRYVLEGVLQKFETRNTSRRIYDYDWVIEEIEKSQTNIFKQRKLKIKDILNKIN